MKKLFADEPLATLVIVHGAFEHSGRYDRLAAKFQSEGFHVIYGDLPGQGSTYENRGHINFFEEYIEETAAWLQEASSLGLPLFVIGHSMGGIVVIRTMQKLRPEVNGVILSSPALGIKDAPSKWLTGLTKALNVLFPKFKVKTPTFAEKVTRNPRVIAQDKQDPYILKKVSVRWYSEFASGIEKAFRDYQAFPDVPLLVMQAGQDLMVEKEKTEEWFDMVDLHDKTYQDWPDLYHEVFNEPEWEEVVNDTLSFIKQRLNHHFVESGGDTIEHPSPT
ncbi:alpha/beta hydrolase [Thalassobacillus sp. CUG 92003]|uniref:alpha/beta hydrolase n=1 Tax=Thalassobacillus sp. CUG 92003 TaxID=2736641 RepID=UPI0015E788BD|nr:alpha/beta hydrolase [Thalassobacillus sp. CUG 92003]